MSAQAANGIQWQGVESRDGGGGVSIPLGVQQPQLILEATHKSRVLQFVITVELLHLDLVQHEQLLCTRQELLVESWRMQKTHDLVELRQARIGHDRPTDGGRNVLEDARGPNKFRRLQNQVELYGVNETRMGARSE